MRCVQTTRSDEKNNAKIIFEMISEIIFEKGRPFWGVLFVCIRRVAGEVSFRLTRAVGSLWRPREAEPKR